MRTICTILTITTPILFYLISFSMWINVVYCKRGPHHPKSEIDVGRHKIVDEHLTHDVEQMEEELNELNMEKKNISEMSDEEKNFYYFKLHDSDNNDVLDGLELLQAATHHNHNKDHNDIAKHQDSSTNNDIENNDEEINHIIDVIDDFMVFADINNDGYLNYPEYAKAVMKTVDDELSTVKEEKLIDEV